jgi:hypothetical protein
VVAVDGEFEPAARLFATAAGRAFRTIRRPIDITDLRETQAHESLLLIGRPEALTHAVLERIAERMEIPWGVLTARDLAGLSFMLAKQMVSGPSTADGRAVFVNTMLRTILRRDDMRRFARDPLNPPGVVDELLGQEWETLGIVAHGERGHANLESTVLCGLLDDREKSASGIVLEGCLREGNQRRCKRVLDPRVHVASFEELRAAQLFLFTCTGFILGSELYPTSINSILSAVEGYPRTIVASDRINVTLGQMPDLVLELLDRATGIAPILELLNDLHAKRYGCRPFMMCGDPVGGGIEWRHASADRRLVVPSGHTMVPFRLDDSRGPEVVAVRPASPAVEVIRGTRGRHLLITDAGTAGIHLLDATRRLQRRARWFERAGAGMRRAAWLERAALRRCREPLGSVAGYESLMALVGVRVAIEQCVQAGVECCRKVEDQGVWTSEITRWSMRIRKQIEEWDRGFARLAERFLFDSADIPGILTDGMVERDRAREGRCEHCNLPLRSLRAAAPFGDQGDQYQTDCHLCLRWENWGAVVPRLAVTVRWRDAGRPDCIEVTRPSTPRSLLVKGQVVIDLEDKASGKPAFRRRFTTAQGKIAVSLPELQLSPDLHTVSVLWVQGLDAAFHRRRLPVYRFPTAGDP